MQTIYLHIGTHKTGSTALQRFLSDKIDSLSDAGIAFYEGMFEKDNHIELHVASMRLNRRSFSKDKYHLQGSQDFQNEVQKRVAAFQDANKSKNLIFTAEGLYLLKYNDEIEALKRIINFEGYNVVILLVTRNKNDFLASMRAQIKKVPNRDVSLNPESHLYVEADSWLARYDEIKAFWGSQFGDKSLRVIDYDLALRAGNGNVLPVMLESLKIPEKLRAGCETYFYNRRTKWSLIKQRLYSLTKSL